MSSGTRRLRRALLGAIFILLSGCFQVQLNGPVADATITVSSLTNPNDVYASATSWDPDHIISINDGATWNAATPVTRLWLLGVFTLNVNALDDDTYYLVTASGGMDTDVDGNRKEDAAYTPVVGQWRAIMSGAELKEVGPKITPLSEAIYLWLEPQLASLNALQIQTNLQRATTQLLSDVDGDGSTDYNDLLSWSPQFHKASLQISLAEVSEIANHVTVGGNDSERSAMAGAVLPIAITTETGVTPDSYFVDHIAGQVLDAACQSCHVENGPSGNTRLVFEQRGADNEDSRNAEIFEEFLRTVDGGGALVLSKVQGVDHGGGAWFTSQSGQYAALSTYIGLVSGDSGGGDGGSGGPTGNFWDGLIMADAGETLRRAALIFAGRLPTAAEYAEAEQGEAGLRSALRGLLQGDGFHDFLVTGANDRLHTDGFLNGLPFDILDANFPFYPVMANRQVELNLAGQQEAYWEWQRLIAYGTARSPLELIAYVVETDRPYTEIVTADYMLANPQMSEVYRSGVDHGTDDPNDFRRAIHKGQIFQDEALVGEFTQDIGHNIDGHSGYLRYPHAGVLNTMAYLNRYPTTETNRNRARARWTYLHFLGVDIEKSAGRTTDPEALADTNNPTMNNPACNVCHQLHDPVAGAFQNYGNEGWYRSAWGGKDALPDTYKYPQWFDENAPPSPYQEGDTWFRDMRAPGMPNEPTTRKATSLQWLGQRIAADDRFAAASVRFWWPAVFGADVLEAPGSASDNSYQQLLAAFEQQTEDINDLADGLRDGFEGGKAYNLKDLLVEMAMSGWFRTTAIEPGADNGRERELETVGTDRLLTPLELEQKTRELFGASWGEWPDEWQIDGVYTALADRFRIYYGGIDSVGVRDRAREMTTLMSNVATRQAIEMSCRVVVEDFARSDEQRRLFSGLSHLTSPGQEGGQSYQMPPDYASRTTQALSLQMQPGDKRLRINFDNSAWDEVNEVGRQLYVDNIRITRNGAQVAYFEGEEFRSAPGFEQRIDFWEGEYYDSGDVHWEEVTPGNWQEVGWVIWAGQGWISLPLEANTAGEYAVEVTGWGARMLDNVAVEMTVSVSDTNPYADSAGATALRTTIQSLHSKLLGQEQDLDHPEITASYELLVETWLDRRENNFASAQQWPEEDCNLPEEFWGQDGTLIDQALNDPASMKGSWSSVMAYLITHYSFLHE